jgi:zinc protease
MALAGITALGLAQQARALDIQDITTPGGITYWLVQEPSIPIVSVEIVFDGGYRLDPPDQTGVAQMVASLMDEGAGDLDAVAFAKAKGDLAARFGFSAGRDNFKISALMLAEEAEASVALLATALTAPRFDPQPIDRVRAQMLSSIAEGETNPSTVAQNAWYARAFPDHPYGRPVSGETETVTALTRADLVAAHDALLTRANATVSVVGAVDAETASALIDTLLSGVPQGTPHVLPETPDAPPPGTEVVSLPVPQSVAIFGHKGLPRDDPDFIPAYVMNYILGGGGFSSRLMEEVREKRGLAYGVYSYLSTMKGAALYLGSVQTANERMAESLDVVRGEWGRMGEKGLTEEDLQKAKQYLTGAFALQFDSNAKIADYLVFVQQEDLGIDYFDRRNGLVEAVTLEQVRAVADRLLKPDALSVVVVGQPAGL